MSVIMMETHTEHSADKKSSNCMSTVKPMRAAACEQSSLQICHFLCGCWYSCNDLPLKCQQEPQFLNFSSYLKNSSWRLMLVVVVFTCKAVFKAKENKSFFLISSIICTLFVFTVSLVIFMIKHE